MSDNSWNARKYTWEEFMPCYCNLKYFKLVCLICCCGVGVSLLFLGKQRLRNVTSCVFRGRFPVQCHGVMWANILCCRAASSPRAAQEMWGLQLCWDLQAGWAPCQACPCFSTYCGLLVQASEVGYKVQLGAFMSRRNVYLTSSKATNKYKKLIGKVLTGS